MKETIDQNGAGAVKTAKFFTVRNMAFIAVMAALICVAAPWSVPMPGLVPVSLATFAVYLAGSLLGWKKGTIAVLIYVLLGAVGLPVFSGGAGGFAKLFGVTGGYIVGYLPYAVLAGLPPLGGKDTFWGRCLMLALGTLVCYALGTAWFMAQSGNPLGASLSMCVLPFLPGDAAKIALAAFLAPRLRKALRV